MDSGLSPSMSYQSPSSAAPSSISAAAGGGSPDAKTIQDHLHVQALIRAYQVSLG